MGPYPLYLLWAAQLARTVAGAPFAGPFLAYVDKFSRCADDESTNRILMTMTITPFNIREPYALQIVNGKLSFNRTFDDTYWTRTRIDSRSTDGHRWMKNAFLFNFPTKGCSVFREQAPDWYRVLLGDVITSGKECTVPPGVYPIEKQSVNWTFPNVPIMPYGFMRFHSTFGRGRETDFCFQAEFHSIPRPKPGNIG